MQEQPGTLVSPMSDLLSMRRLVQWMLGFVDDAESPATLLRHRFPSKVGGRPVSAAKSIIVGSAAIVAH